MTTAMIFDRRALRPAPVALGPLPCTYFFAAQIAPGWGTRGNGGVRVEGATGPRRRVGKATGTRHRAQGGWKRLLTGQKA
jgi:hypothetical protein